MTKRELLASLNITRTNMRDEFVGASRAAIVVAGKITCEVSLSESDLTHLIAALTKDVREEETVNGCALVDCTATGCWGSEYLRNLVDRNGINSTADDSPACQIAIAFEY